MVPSLFLAHGSPMLAIEDTPYTAFLAEYGKKLNPKAIVIFTAHWEQEVLTVSSRDGTYGTIYDFYGFPPELYQVKYPAKGSTEIAARVIEIFRNHHIEAAADVTRGLDHGSWTLLSRMFPAAGIPVVQISVNPFLPPEEQYKIGEALRGLGDEDILVIGSGVTVHNLRILKWGQSEPEAWAAEFDDWLIEKIRNRHDKDLFEYERLAPGASTAVPRPEHFVPLFIALGSAPADSGGEVIYRGYEAGTLSYLCFRF